MIDKNYLISVIIPTYNRAELLEKALLSVVRQSYQNLEVIVIDDASSDETLSVVNKFGSGKIIYHRNPVNKGVAYSRNKGMSIARGDFIALLDDDDLWQEKKIQRQLETALSLPKDTFICCNGTCQGWKKNVLDPALSLGYIANKAGFFPVREHISYPSSWFFTREIAKAVGPFNESLYAWEDQDYFIRMCLKFPVYFLNEMLVAWNRVGQHLSAISEKHIEAKEKFLEIHYQLMLQDKYYLYRFYYFMAKDCLRIEMKEKARSYFLKALRLKPYKLEVIHKIFKTLL